MLTLGISSPFTHSRMWPNCAQESVEYTHKESGKDTERGKKSNIKIKDYFSNRVPNTALVDKTNVTLKIVSFSCQAN